MKRSIGGNAQDRRRARRAASRRRKKGVAELRASDVLEIRQIVAAATDETTVEVDLAGWIDAELGEGWQKLGGKPSKGTKSDKRLKENDSTAQPEDLALDALEAFRPADPVRALAAAFVKARRPDLEGFEAEVEQLVRRVVAAAGDVAWGTEEGFMDLLADINALLHDEADDYGPPWAIDASVKLDKVLICDEDGYFVAPITIGADGEPVLSDRAEWLAVEEQLVESDDQEDDGQMTGGRLRLALRAFALRADGATAPALPTEHEPAEVVPAHGGDPTPPAESVVRGGSIPWTATFVPEGVLTEDGRAFAPGALLLPPEEGSRELPLTLMGLIETSAEGGHDRAKVAGRIDELWRESGGGAVQLVKSSGVFSDEDWGQMIARMVESKELTGLSVDIAPLQYEWGPRAGWFDDAGNWIAQRDENGDWQPVETFLTPEEEADSAWDGDEIILVITRGVIGMATVCPFPAFGKASISLAASGAVPISRFEAEANFKLEPSLVASATTADAEKDCGCVEAEPETVTAAAAGLAPAAPPSDWFADPELAELTPLTISDDGRVFGHAWAWKTCHLSFDECVVAPHSETAYAYFQLGEVECDDGEMVPVGKITLDTSHAGQRLSRAEATRHYDDTGTVAAYVTFGEDEFGGWFAGALNPDLSESAVRTLRGATISGDWRGVEGNLELVALLAVNVPGFPVPRAPRVYASAAEGAPAEVVTLTAAGIVLSEQEADEIRALTGEVVDGGEG